MSYRLNPAWQAARARLLDPPGCTPTDFLIGDVLTSVEMFLIESDHVEAAADLHRAALLVIPQDARAAG